MGYEITYANGADASFVATYEDALCVIADRWPDAEVGHDGDLTSGGDRTLVWATEADAVNDDGARAVACIRRVEP
jgi:hypothetical protein